MRLGIMQPYFFPNLAHFALINATDNWIVFDITQYTRKSWINRNRILHPIKGWQYISVPLASSSTKLKIHEIQVANLLAFHQSLRGKLSHYYKMAPNYDEVLDLVDQTFEKATDNSLTALNISGLSVVCSYLNVPFNYRTCSKLGLEFPSQMKPGEWAPFIARNLGTNCYVNPIGGCKLFRSKDFTDYGIDIQFARFGDFTYPTPGHNFVPGLSILDVLMWNPPHKVRDSAFGLMELLTSEELNRDSSPSTNLA
jgi:hypothetical protein